MAETRHLRKFAFIVHSDVVGSSKFVQMDEEVAHDRIRDAFRRFSGVIESYGGVVHELRGDALVAVFERASDAVSASISFQDQNARHTSSLAGPIRPILRIGIGMGEVVLADHTITGAGVVLAQRLEQLAEPGGVIIQGAVQQAIPRRLPFEFVDLGEREFKGFDEPIRSYGVFRSSGRELPAPEDISEVTSTNRKGSGGNRRLIVAVVSLVIVAAAAGVAWIQPWRQEEPSAPSRTVFERRSEIPSIAVLPFTNISGDPDQEYFADGMTEDLITDLSKVSGLFVIARNSTFTYKGMNVDIRDVGRELGARYVLEGSARRADDVVRINAQLIDAETGRHLWAERYDGTMENIFELQDNITRKIVSDLAVTLSREESLSIEGPLTKDTRAYVRFLQAREYFYRYSKDDVEKSRILFEETIALDPSFAPAYAMLAWSYWFDFSNAWTSEPDSALANAATLAQKALDMDDALPLAHFVKGLVHRERKEYAAALSEAEKAIGVDPNYANGRVLLATVLYYTGRAEEGLEQIQEAMRLEPHHPHNYPFHEGQAFFILGRYDDAIRTFRQGLTMNPTSQRLRLWLAASYAQAGRVEDASWELDQVLLADPDLSLSRIKGAYPFRYSADMENFLEALSKAGLE